MAVSSKDSSGAGGRLSVRIVDVTDLEGPGLSDITSGSTTVYAMDLDNTANGATTFFRIFDSSSPVFGADDPSVMIAVAASTRQVWTVAQGLSLGTGMSLMASTDDGAGTTGANPVASFNASFVVV